MSEIDDLRAQMQQARAELLAALDGVTQEQLERQPPPGAEGEAQWSMVEVLWHVGHTEDRLRRTVDQALGGRPITDDAPRSRPAYLVTRELLTAWLEQTRRPTEVLLRDMAEADLDREFLRPNGSTRTPRWVLELLVRHDRDHAAQVRTLRELEPASSGGEA